MRMARLTAALTMLILILCGGVVAQEVGPREVIPLPLEILPLESMDEPLPVLADGVLEYSDDCDYCYLGVTQYEVEVPAGVLGLSIELVNTTDPDGDIDLIVRVGRPVTEDESSYYYDYRTYGSGGFESLALPEEGLDEVPAGTYYLGIVGFVEAGAIYEVRAAAYVREILPDSEALTPNVGIEGELAAMSVSAGQGTQYRIDVAAEAELLAVRVTALPGDVDLYVGRHPVVIHADGRATAEIQLRGSGIDELLLLEGPAPGAYWIAVANPTHQSVRYMLTATCVPQVVSLALGIPIVDAAGYEGGLVDAIRPLLRTDGGLLSVRQYRIDLPTNLAGALVRLRGTNCCDLALHLRYGEPVRIVDGAVEADLSLLDGAEKEAVLRGTFLRPGETLYIAVERLGASGEKAFTLVVSADGG